MPERRPEPEELEMIRAGRSPRPSLIPAKPRKVFRSGAARSAATWPRGTAPPRSVPSARQARTASSFSPCGPGRVYPSGAARSAATWPRGTAPPRSVPSARQARTASSPSLYNNVGLNIIGVRALNLNFTSRIQQMSSDPNYVARLGRLNVQCPGLTPLPPYSSRSRFISPLDTSTSIWRVMIARRKASFT